MTNDILLCAIAKCENNYIKEWVDWHLRLGFDRIVIYDNNDTDGELISDVVGGMKTVEIIDWRGKTQESCETQVKAYNHCYKTHMDYKWIMFLDIDEFLEFEGNISIKEFFKKNESWTNVANVIKFHWKCYSDGESLYYSDKPVTERFKTLCKKDLNCFTKSIYRGGLQNLIMMNVHYCHDIKNVFYQNGKRINYTPYSTDCNINYDCGWVRHYITKSLEEYVYIKYARRGNGSSKKRLNDNFYFIYNTRTKEKERLFASFMNDIKYNGAKNKFKNENTKRNTVENIKQVPSISVRDNSFIVDDNIIVSFTSWTKRIQYCKHTVDLMMAQTVKPNKIILNLSTDEFPNKEKDLPKDLVDAQNDIFEIYWVKENTKVYKKITPTLDRFPNDVIVSIDDDIEYPNDFIEVLYKTYISYDKKHPICCYKNHERDYDVYRHSGPFTLTKKEFYNNYFNELYENVVHKYGLDTTFCYDTLYYYSALLNSCLYKVVDEQILNDYRKLYDDSNIDRTDRYSLYDKIWKEKYENELKLIRNYIYNKYNLTYSNLVENAKTYNNQKVYCIIQTKFSNPLDFENLLLWYRHFIKCDKLIIVDDDSSFDILTIVQRFKDNSILYIKRSDIDLMQEDKEKPNYNAQQKIYNNIIKTLNCNINDIIIIPDDDEYWWYDNTKFKSFKECVNTERHKNDMCDSIVVPWTLISHKELMPHRKLNQTMIDTFLYRSTINTCDHKPIMFYNGCGLTTSFHNGYLNHKSVSTIVNDYYWMSTTKYDYHLRIYHYRYTTESDFINRRSSAAGTHIKKTHVNERYEYQIYNGENQNSNYIKYDDTVFKTLQNIKTLYYKNKIIVSFTTWKKRQECAVKMLDYFKKQTLKPHKIVCWLSSDEYEGENVPKVLQKFEDSGFIEIQWVKENTYCHKRYEIFKKYIDNYVFFIDDDIYYEPTYLQEMYNAARTYRECVITYTGDNLEIINDKNYLGLKENPSLTTSLLSGVSCYPPKIFPLQDYLNNLLLRDTISPKCDDSFLKALCIKNNIKIYSIYDRRKKNFIEIPGYDDVGIYKTVNSLKINNIYNKTIIFKNLIKSMNIEEQTKKIWKNIIL